MVIKIYIPHRFRWTILLDYIPVNWHKLSKTVSFHQVYTALALDRQFLSILLYLGVG